MDMGIVSPARVGWTVVIVAVSAVALSGCGGGIGDPVPGTVPTNLPNYHAPEDWIAIIEAAGLQEYADLGRQLVQEGKIRLVSPPTLGEQFNAYAWITEREVWINAPLFSRYPDVSHQAQIFLHELIHIRSQEASHSGPWWTIQDQFAAYCSQYRTAPGALPEESLTSEHYTTRGDHWEAERG